MKSRILLLFNFVILAGAVLAFGAVFFVSACATLTSQRTRSSVPSIEGTLGLPSGWDDSIVDKIKTGESTQKVLAVLDFEGSEKLASKAELRMSEMLQTSLVHTGRFEVIERAKLEQIIQEQNLALTGIIDESKAVQVGKLVGAEYVVFGALTSVTKGIIDKFAYDLVQVHVGCDVRVVNTTTGVIDLSDFALGIFEYKIVRTADGVVVSGAVEDSYAYAEAARDSIAKVGHKIADLSPLVGFVISVEAEQILIDIGEEQGVKIGETFVVFKVEDEILHPATGHRVGWKKKVLQALQVISTEKTMSATKSVHTQSTQPVEVGDYVISR